MQKGTIVFHKIYKFGLVVEDKINISKINFYNDNSYRVMDDNFLYPIEDKQLEFFTNGTFKNFFSNATLTRGKDYQVTRLVKDIDYDGKNYFASVEGTFLYKTKITVKNRIMTSSCSCPVDKYCKHAAALCYELQEIFSILNRIKKDAPSQISLSQEIINAYSLIKSNSRSYKEVRIIIDDLKNNDDQYLISFIKFIYKFERDAINYYYSRNEIMIYYVLTYNDVLRNRIIEIANNDRNKIIGYDEILKYIKKAERVSDHVRNNGYTNVIYTGRLKYINLYYICNGLYEEYLMQALRYSEQYNIQQPSVEFCCEKVEYNDDLYFLLVNNQLKLANCFRKFINKIPKDKKIALFKMPDLEYRITYDDIKDFDRKDKIAIFKKVKFDNDNIVKILNDIDINTDDHKEIASILISMLSNTEKNADRKKIIDLAKKLDNSKILVEYLMGYKNSYSFDHDYYFWRNESNFLAPNKNFNFEKVDIDSFNKYFSVKYTIEPEDDSIDIRFFIYDLLDRVVLEIKREDNTLNVITNYFDEYYDGFYANFLVWYIKNIKNVEFDSDLRKVEKQIAKEKEKEICSYALQDMKELSNKIMQSSMLLVDKAKAKIEYNFDLDEMRLGLKIGISKMYVVKDMYIFFDAFNNDEVIEYGKNLSFAHNLENLDEKDGKIIDFLRKCTRISYDRKYLDINNALLVDLIKMLKGRYITCNNNEYLVSLNSVNPKISLNNDYQIVLNLGEIKQCFLIKSKNTTLFFNSEKGNIDIYEASESDIELLNFANKYNGLCIKSIADEFSSNLLPHFNDKIEIADEIKGNFKTSTITIKAYFDYEDKKISVKEEYYKDDKKISINDFDDNDRIKNNIYKKYLTTLGFVNNEIDEDSRVLAFFYMDFDEIKKYAEVYLSESISNKKVSIFTPATIRVSYDGIIMKAMLEDSKYSDEELKAIMQGLKHKKKFVLLKGERIIDISDKTSEDFYETVDDLKLDINKLNEENRLSLIQSIKALAHQNNCSVDNYLTKMMDDISNFKNSDIKLPTINGELRNYQVDGLKWLSVLSKYNIGGILADDMGLGKTLQVISLIANSKVKKPSIIICPKTLVFNWMNEFVRFAPEIEVCDICGNKENRDAKIKSITKNEKKVYICSYDSLRIDIEEYKVTFDYAILDEAQYIKNVNAQKTISSKKIKADHKFALTGTPIENNLIDLWSIFDFVLPGYFDDLSEFKTRFNDEKFVEMVSKRIAPFVLRRVKQDVLKDLPEKYETILSVDMPDSQRKIYDAFKNEINEKIESGSKAFDILPYLTRLRQICVNPKMFVDKYKGDVAKMELLESLVEDYIQKGHKLLIFSQFVKALEEVETLLSKKKIKYDVITGKIDGKKRIDIVNKFNNDLNEKILLISLKAGGTGLNLIGADTVIHLDPWWNIAAENQASDRAHRIGQKHNVEIIKIICSNSIEQRVIELQNAKKDLIDKVIANNDESIISSSLENIKYLLD